MLKSMERSQPDSCWNRANDDEIIFVLLGRDQAAPMAILKWCEWRISLGKNTETDQQILSARMDAAEIVYRQLGGTARGTTTSQPVPPPYQRDKNEEFARQYGKVSEMRKLWAAIQEWQERQFGTAQDRGPLGPLRHLRKEAEEAANQAIASKSPPGESLRPYLQPEEVLEGSQFWEPVTRLRGEIADCLFMLIESAWRSNLTIDDLMLLCWQKLTENKERKWPPPTAEEPVEHEGGETNQLERLRTAAAKYRCLCRSEGPTGQTFEAGRDLDAVLAEIQPSDVLPPQGE
jgi:hypothetical protein